MGGVAVDEADAAVDQPVREPALVQGHVVSPVRALVDGHGDEAAVLPGGPGPGDEGAGDRVGQAGQQADPGPPGAIAPANVRWYSGSCRYASWTRSRPSRPRLSASGRLTRSPERSPVPGSASALAASTDPSGRPPAAVSARPVRSSAGPPRGCRRCP